VPSVRNARPSRQGGTVGGVPVRAGEPSDAAFIVTMAQLASVMEDDPLPPADDPALLLGLPPSSDTAVVALDDDGRPVGAAWWHLRDRSLVVAPDGAPVPEIVVAVVPAGPAAHLYSRAGFVVAGKGRGPLGVAMVRELR